MDSRERVLTAIHHAEPDRVPIDFWATPPMLGRLLQGLGYLPDEDTTRTDVVQHSATVREAMMHAHIRLLEGFGTDFREVHPQYIGPPPQELPDGSRTSMFGGRSVTVHTQFGSYDHDVSYPLDDVTTPEEVLTHSCWPDPEWFDYESLVPQCATAQDYAVLTGSFSVWNFSFYTRGMERILLDLAEAPEIADAVIEGHTRFAMQYYERTLEAAKGAIDIVRTYDDYGTQLGLMMAPAQWRGLVKPRLVALVDLVHRYGAKFMLHSCGSVVDVLPDVIDAGVDILDPVQTRARGMDPETLKQRFGSRICFHGGLDTQDVLPHGSPQDVEEEVKHLLRALAPGGGYLFNSSQALLADTPLENVRAMYKAAHRWGTYPLDLNGLATPSMSCCA